MAHQKSKKVYYCHWVQHNIMASYCDKCDYVNCDGKSCKYENKFNDCKIISNNVKKDIDNAYK